MRKSFIVVGAGAFAREVISWIEAACAAGLAADIKGYVSDPAHGLLPDHYGLVWLGSVADHTPSDADEHIMAISNPTFKRPVAEALLAKGAVFGTFAHPSVAIARTARIGRGGVLCPHVMVSADAVVDDFVTLNTHATVGHDSHIGAMCTLSSHVDITGHVQVGEAVFFGSGARVLPKLKVGDRARVGAGAVVMRSVPAEATVYAPPAKRL